MKLKEARRRARKCAVQAIYSWQISRNSISNIEYQFLVEQNIKNIDVIYFRDLLSGVIINNVYIDKLIQPYLIHLLQKLGQIEKAVLRIAIFEFYKRNDIPYKVTINEAIELAKIFGSEDCYKFVNAVLDKVASTIFLHK